MTELAFAWLLVAAASMLYYGGRAFVAGTDIAQFASFTTGQDGIYPPGLNVGRVVDVKNGTATHAHQILIHPGAQLDHLEEVAVLLYRPPQRSAPQETLPNVEKSGK